MEQWRPERLGQVGQVYMLGRVYLGKSAWAHKLPKRKAEDMEVLEKVVVAIFKSPQLRDVLLYATLLLIFATAWVCYRWSAFAIPAVVIACLIVSAEALIIYFVAKRMKASSATGGKADGKHP
jgi:hypothetical protein